MVLKLRKKILEINECLTIQKSKLNVRIERKKSNGLVRQLKQPVI